MMTPNIEQYNIEYMLQKDGDKNSHNIKKEENTWRTKSLAKRRKNI